MRALQSRGCALASQARPRRAAQVTPLHTDPHHNLLAQVVGVKYVRLYPPAAAAVLCPFREGLTTNSSQARQGAWGQGGGACPLQTRPLVLQSCAGCRAWLSGVAGALLPNPGGSEATDGSPEDE